MMTTRSLLVMCAALLAGGAVLACDIPVSVCTHGSPTSLALVRAGQPAAVYVDANADAALRHVAASFTDDLQRVSGQPAHQLATIAEAKGELVIITQLGHSAVLDDLVKRGKLQLPQNLAGQWEAFQQRVVDQPFPNVPRALVIIGADRRGAVFGTYDLSAKMGVSPWYWWADVPVKQQTELYLTAGQRSDAPQVKYRGFFINDEDPSLKTWAQKKYGGVNSKMYEPVFELLLRLKGNYLWPAMWQPKAFAADDPRSMVLADEMGVIMGTSHHEPMMRAHDEWARAKAGKWDYSTNAPALREFWRGGLERMMSKGDGQGYESLVTIGMRGDGDEPMAQGTAIDLLQTIVKDQRAIIADVTKKPAEQTPQMWALYKEVQDYYDQGMQVPDDVLLLFSDDNWGQIRRLPTKDLGRKGGYGVYYHFDYVGGPRNYKWINTTQIEKTWQQMDLAHQRGANALWVVNVGDIKPLEYPLSFFLDMAWNPSAMTLDAMTAYAERFARATFGDTVAKDIASVLTRYTQYAARRKPELIDPQTWPLGSTPPSADALDGGEFGRLVAQWDQLERGTQALKPKLRPERLDAYFELVEHPVTALANLYRLHYYAAWNQKLAARNDPRANSFAEMAEAAFQHDQRITDLYHQTAGGKWDGMMLQTHIGYSYWQQPKTNVMPKVTRVAGGAPSAEAVRAQLAKGLAAATPSPRITLEATAFTRAVNGKGLGWATIPYLGASQGAVTAFPQGREATTVQDNVHLEYEFNWPTAGNARVSVLLSPTLNTRDAQALRLGLSVDDGPVQTLSFNLQPTGEGYDTQVKKDWAQAVIANAWPLNAELPALSAGRHTLKLWRLDDNVLVQRLALVLAAASALP
jgi:hypothetical protein